MFSKRSNCKKNNWKSKNPKAKRATLIWAPKCLSRIADFSGTNLDRTNTFLNW